MNIFGVGGAELVVIIMIMLIVAGPKRMIRWAYVIGQYVGKFRILWAQMVDVMQEEVDAAGLDVKLPREIPTKQSLAQTAGQLMKPYTESLENTLDEVAKPIKETVDETNKTVEEVKKETKTSTTVKMGSWTDKKKVVDTPAEATPTDTTPPDTGFGAWSQPKSSGQEIEHEA